MARLSNFLIAHSWALALCAHTSSFWWNILPFSSSFASFVFKSAIKHLNENVTYYDPEQVKWSKSITLQQCPLKYSNSWFVCLNFWWTFPVYSSWKHKDFHFVALWGKFIFYTLLTSKSLKLIWYKLRAEMPSSFRLIYHYEYWIWVL